MIKEISGLSNLHNLSTLNLAHNSITRVSGLESCLNLTQIDLSWNHIIDIKECEMLQDLPLLTCLDLRNNHIENHDDIVPFFEKMTQLLCLYLKNNPC